jgi:UDP-N-acetyl-2-amino-2-deoxyglucuronate dehydrogenase
MQHYPTITDRSIRIAIVGCGRISKNHFDSFEKHAADLELAAVCDIDPLVLAEHTAHYKVVRATLAH